MGAHRHVAFGLLWDSDVALEQFAAIESDGRPADIVVHEVAGPLPPRAQIVGFDGASLCHDGIRFWVNDELVFDFYSPDRVHWLRGAGWTGRFPALFYGTVTALLLAWRGAIPIHGSAVELDGRAFLICGPSGAGKSTLAAALVASGRARLIADDLSALAPSPGGHAMLHAGRPTIRLFPATASNMPANCTVTTEDGMDKVLVTPPRVAPLTPIPLAATLILGADARSMPIWRRGELLDAQLFRPRWMRRIPGWKARFKRLHDIATNLPMLSIDEAAIRSGEAFRARATEVLAHIAEY